MRLERSVFLRTAITLAILGLAAAALGETQQAGLPRGKVLLENDRVLVVEGTLAPGEATGMHKHPLPAVVICIEGGTLKETFPDGTTRTYERKTGDMAWRQKDFQHDEINVGQTRERVIAVQLKP